MYNRIFTIYNLQFTNSLKCSASITRVRLVDQCNDQVLAAPILCKNTLKSWCWSWLILCQLAVLAEFVKEHETRMVRHLRLCN